MGLFDKAKESIVKAKESAQEAYDQAKGLAQESTQETFDKAKDSEVVKLIIPIIEDKMTLLKQWTLKLLIMMKNSMKSFQIEYTVC